jgi:hypothetical protein
MKRVIYIFLVLMTISPIIGFCQWDKYFENKSLRVDFSHSGRVGIEYCVINSYKMLPFFSGSKTFLIDTTNNGAYKIAILDKNDDKIIYSKGYSSLFNEWLSTKDATHMCGNFEETLILPFPKNDADLVFYSRDSLNNWKEVTRINIDRTLIEEVQNKEKTKIIPLNTVNKPMEKRLDVVIIPVGYTKQEKDKMIKDLNTFNSYFFSISPYSEAKDKINIVGIEDYSSYSGIPGLKPVTVPSNELGVTYNTFGSERYIMTQNMWTLMDKVNDVPCDALILMCNSNVYGGGGIYNYYATCYVGEKSREVLVHEFSHSFAGLGDEYSDNDSDAGLQSETCEPYEKNLTTLKDFSKKWKNMIDKTTPIPTPNTEEYKDKVGVFEGASYKSKGFYRPSEHCMMRDLYPFCPVCVKVINDMLDIYSK